MVEVSKHMFDKACANLECCELLHPWSDNCLLANVMCFTNSIKGSYQFYAYVYMLQMAMRGKLSSLEEVKQLGQQYVKSGVLGLLVSSSACTLNCIMRNCIIGKFSYYTFVLLPNTLNGLVIYLEPPGRRGLVINLFANLVIEYWIRWQERAGCINVTPAKMTLFFMFGSAFLFYLMRLEGDREKRTHLLWLFTPEKVNRTAINNSDLYCRQKGSSLACPHEGPCWRHVLKGTGKLFGVGCAITAARVLPTLRAVSSLQFKHLRLALFFGCYIGIYRVWISSKAWTVMLIVFRLCVK